jgi:hypothetical protein
VCVVVKEIYQTGEVLSGFFRISNV